MVPLTQLSAQYLVHVNLYVTPDCCCLFVCLFVCLFLTILAVIGIMHLVLRGVNSLNYLVDNMLLCRTRCVSQLFSQWGLHSINQIVRYPW